MLGKLLILDKDGTLTRPKSGGTFVQHPEDQELILGVAETLRRYEDDGWSMAIASNQGGCAVFEILAEDIKAGMSIELDGNWVKVHEVDSTTHLLINLGRYTIEGLYKARYKSIEDARAEMAFALKLANIRIGFFCPDMDGSTLQIVDWHGNGNKADRYGTTDWDGQFRKPSPGMLLHIAAWAGNAASDCLMVGDRPEDQGAAQAAGIDFMWAEDWLNQ